MNRPLKQNIQQHLNDKQLSAEQFQALLQMQMASSKTDKIKHPGWFKTMTAASVLACAFIGAYLFSTEIFTTQRIEQRIAMEVAKNHLKLKPLETSSDTIEEIRAYFKQLDFLPIKPGFLNASGQKLIGGRYCSIQGLTAAQLRLKDKAGKIHSLYETQYDSKLFPGLPQLENSEQPVTVYAKGIKVDIWVEKDVLFALTGSSSLDKVD